MLDCSEEQLLSLANHVQPPYQPENKYNQNCELHMQCGVKRRGIRSLPSVHLHGSRNLDMHHKTICYVCLESCEAPVKLSKLQQKAQDDQLSISAEFSSESDLGLVSQRTVRGLPQGSAPIHIIKI